MAHLNIDLQPEAVKQFFESLVLAPEGSVVEMNGRPMARMLPAETDAATNGASEWTPADNHRRCELIDKKYQIGLTPAEETELATLKAGPRHFMDRVAPVPLDNVRTIHPQLLEKPVAAQSNSGV